MRHLGALGGLGLVVGLVVGAGCWRPQLDHCGSNDGDRTCAERGIGMFCNVCQAANDGCTEVRPTEACWLPGVGGSDEGGSTGSTAGDDEAMSGTSSDMSTTSAEVVDSSGTTGAEPCVVDEECSSAEQPFCGAAGVCVSCDGTEDGDAACAASDPGSSVCTDGACVQCTPEKLDACPGAIPVCGDGNACVSCSEHDNCGDAACNLYTGLCLPPDAVVHVGPGQEFASLTTAAASFEPGAEGTIIVHQGVYHNLVTVGGGSTLAFLANKSDLPVWSGFAGARQLWVTEATVLLDGLSLSGNGGSYPAVQLTGAQSRLWADRSRIVANSGGGVLVESAAELTLRNCFVGGDAYGVAALQVDAATATVSYSTIIGDTSPGAAALLCSINATVAVDDSVLLVLHPFHPPMISCEAATFVHSASEVDLPGATNTNVGSFTSTTDWFTDVFTGDFTLTPTGAATFAGLARWDTGDPATDIQGDLRPGIHGAVDYAGADVP